MAVTSIHPIKSTLKSAIDYICNPEKTDEKLLISSFGCAPETADIEFDFTLSNSVMNKGNNLAHHLIQAFEPGEVEYDEAHRIGEELAAAVLGGKYEYVLTTHIDKGHIHNHIIFCAASFVDRHKYVSNKGSLYGIRNASDRLCREHNLSTVIPGKGQDKGFIEYTDEHGNRQLRPAKGKAITIEEINAEKRGASWKAKLKEAIDGYISVAADFEDFLRRMEADGYTIKRAKYHSYKIPGQERFTGGPTLGAEYTDERIKERIDGLTAAPKRKRVQLDDGRINLIIDIENSIKAQQSAGYAHWAKLHNLKEAAKTVLFLQDNHILAYQQLSDKIAEIQALFDDTHATIKGAEKRITDLSLLIKNIENFRRTYPAYKAYRQAKDPDTVFRQQESKIIVHEAARKALQSMGVLGGKLPDTAALKAQRDKLTAEKAALYEQYSSLKKQVAEYGKIKANIDQVLGANRPEEQRDNSRQM